MATFSVPGAELDYTTEGSGPPLVLLHGLTASRDNEIRNRLDFRSLRDTHTLTAYDARGHGRSTGRTEPDDYRWPQLADDLLALIDHLHPDEPVDALGVSMGVGTLLHAATTHPDRFRRLVLVIPPTAWQTRAAQASVYRDGADLVEAQGSRALARAARLLPLPPAQADLPERVAPDIPDKLLAAAFRGAAVSDLPAPEAISQLEQPTLILAWADDPGHPTETAERLLDLLPDVELNVAHTPQQRDAWPQLAADHLR
ncbi:alpha/beta fold hydrolase [Flexivirga sp. ID2601S]|uniref:Alpha/beta fold hydrolase n=1 Tax=Flexivirga aerilata TaxID=1656889 RepID=A0A849AJJ4_9MICO|nr:alpha/beta fold hydrolase [Flexivirga aerilata]NNG38570.1 alpha/beta fold hydrolase [Flexivirga aerilata]